MSKFEYPILIEPLTAEDGGGFLATVPDLPGCMSDGETPDEALLNVRDAIACWIEGAKELGYPIPSPTMHGGLSIQKVPPASACVPKAQ
jgi:predicted RNase H-like HicB family nuclease